MLNGAAAAKDYVLPSEWAVRVGSGSCSVSGLTPLACYRPTRICGGCEADSARHCTRKRELCISRLTLDLQLTFSRPMILNLLRKISNHMLHESTAKHNRNLMVASDFCVDAVLIQRY